MDRSLDRQLRRSSHAARLHYNAAVRLINVGTRTTLLCSRLNSSKFFVPGQPRTRKPMHSFDQLILMQSAEILSSGQSEISGYLPCIRCGSSGRRSGGRVNVRLSQPRDDCHIPCHRCPILPWDKKGHPDACRLYEKGRMVLQ